METAGKSWISSSHVVGAVCSWPGHPSPHPWQATGAQRPMRVGLTSSRTDRNPSWPDRARGMGSVGTNLALVPPVSPLNSTRDQIPAPRQQLSSHRAVLGSNLPSFTFPTLKHPQLGSSLSRHSEYGSNSHFGVIRKHFLPCAPAAILQLLAALGSSCCADTTSTHGLFIPPVLSRLTSHQVHYPQCHFQWNWNGR